MKTSIFSSIALAAVFIINVGAIPASSNGKGLGQSCTMSSQCINNFFCNKKSCSPKADDNSQCYKDNGCKSGLCSGKVCLGQSNRPLKAECTTSEQCSTGYCGRSICSKKATIGQYCYKDAGCQDGSHCGSKNKCVSGSSLGFDLGHPCTSSGQCASTLCEYSKCANKHKNGEACYKNNACLSNFCKDSKICSASSTTTTNSTTTTPTTTPTPTGTPSLKDTTWTDLSAYQVSGSGTLSIVRNSTLCDSEPSCGQAVIPAGGSISITQPLVNSLRKRDNNGPPHFVTTVPIKVIEFSPELGELPNGGYAGPTCDLQYTANGVASSHQRISQNHQLDFPDSGGSGTTWDNTLTSMGLNVICEEGATVTILIGSMSFIDVYAFLSSESAGLSPTLSSNTITATDTISQSQGTGGISTPVN